MLTTLVAGSVIIGMASPVAGHVDDEAAPIFGIKVPSGYRDWPVVSVAHEEGSLNDLRAVLGNKAATNAYREGKLPFPDGTIIARLAWAYVPSEENNKVLAVSNLSLPGHPQTFSLWLKIQKSMQRRAAGDLLNLKTGRLTPRPI